VIVPDRRPVKFQCDGDAGGGSRSQAEEKAKAEKEAAEKAEDKKDVPAKTKKSPIKGVGPAAVRANEPELGPLLRLSLVNQNIKNLTELVDLVIG
jgi:hypothetical protein